MQPSRSDWKIDVPLTNISIAYMQNANNFVAGDVFPLVSVDKRSDKYFTYDKNDFLRDEAEERAPGTESAGSGYNMSSDSYYCGLPAIHKDIDNKDISEAQVPLDFLRDATEWVSQRLMLRKEVQFVSDFFTTSVWGTDLTPANLWSDYTNGDPISDIATGQETVLKNTGFEANTLVVGYEVWTQLKNHPDFVDRYKHTSADALTPQLVARILEVDRLLVAKSIKATNVEGGTAAYDFTHGKHALLCYVNPRPSLRQPSAGYVFGWRGLNGGSGNHRVRQFEIERLDVTRVEGEESYDFKVIGSDLGYFFDGAVA